LRSICLAHTGWVCVSEGVVVGGRLCDLA